ncbi:MAG TPA: hypothetical protein DDW30_00375 [Clostridiales bacterium]|nr:hypothetical protein [Clostridiales bacterium]
MKNRMTRNRRRGGVLLALLLLTAVLISGCGTGFSDPTAPDTKTNTQPETKKENTSDTTKDTTKREETTTAPQNQTEAKQKGYVVVTDTVKADGSTDVTKALQDLIDANPNRTLFFPDGTYLISSPLKTPADPMYAVSLLLSDFAVIKASPKWFSSNAMICLGGKLPANSSAAGSNYSLIGGVIDGSGIASAVSIDSGRETRIQNIAIKNALIGIHIKYGANNGSSDADISNVSIIGNGTALSTGILVEGYDNTITNVRIGNVQVGVRLKSGANMLRNIHPLFYSSYSNYETSYGFWDETGTNWYDFCYSDHFRVGFKLAKNVHSTFTNCYVFWYDDNGAGKDYVATAFEADGRFDSTVDGFKAGFRDDRESCVLKVGENGGAGRMELMWITGNSRAVAFDVYRQYLKD